MKNMAKQNVVEEVPEDETGEEYGNRYAINSGGGPVTLNVTVSGNNNTVAVMAGTPPPPPKPPGGNG